MFHYLTIGNEKRPSQVRGEALKATYGYLTPDLWKPTTYVKPPFQDFNICVSLSLSIYIYIHTHTCIDI